MERHAFAMKVKAGRMNDYRKKLGEIWPELTAFLDRNKVKNFSIWNAEDLIFGYYENEDGTVLSEEENAAKDAITAKIKDTFEWISTPGKDMRLMYHNFGIVRENKELIRHRMFMTKLKTGCEEEYKRRHDGLIAQRGDTVDPGPDSNFSIWSAGGYIFGYETSNKEGTTMQYTNYYYYIPASLREVAITDETVISKNAFINCSMIESIIIKSDLTAIGDYAFYNCDGLKTVTIESNTMPTISAYVFNGDSTVVIKVNSSILSDYQSDANWSKRTLEAIQ